MKFIKRIMATVLAAATCVTFSACHAKDEVAITVTDKKTGISTTLTTAQYIYCYTSAVLEANSNIDQNKEDEDKEITDYTKYKVVETDEDGKETKVEYQKWVNQHAEELMRSYAASDIKRKELKFEIDQDTQTTIDSYSQMYWQYYYQSNFEKNGVGLETYTKMFASSYYENQYFLSIYDKKGTDPVAEKTVSKTFYDSYALADTIRITIADETTEDEETTETQGMTLAEAKKLLKGYKTRIANGESFASIYKEYNEEYNQSEDGTDSSTSDSATVYGSEETDSASEYFTEIYKMKNNATKIITSEDESEIVLVQKGDISKDEDSYYKNYRENVLHQLKDDEFYADFEKYAKSLKIEKNESATKRVSIKKIDVTTDTETAE